MGSEEENSPTLGERVAKLEGRATGWDDAIGQLRESVDRVENRLQDRMEKVETNLGERMDRMETNLGASVSGLGQKLDKAIDVNRRTIPPWAHYMIYVLIALLGITAGMLKATGHL